MRSGCQSGFGHQSSDHAEERERAVRLRQVGGRAGLFRPLLVAAQRERRDGDDRRVPSGRLRPEPPGGLEAGDLRELDVHEDQVGTLLQRDAHPRLAVGGLDQPVGRAAQQISNDLLVQLVVLDVEDRPAAHAGLPPARRRGIEKAKVDPVPSSLSTQTRPPCISTNFRVMLSPSPVPPNSLVMAASPCRNSVNRLSILSFAIPIPVSATRYTRSSPWSSTEIVTRPCRVNLSAFPARFMRHCVSRPPSPYASGMSPGTETTNSRPFSAARG